MEDCSGHTGCCLFEWMPDGRGEGFDYFQKRSVSARLLLESRFVEIDVPLDLIMCLCYTVW